MIQIFNIYFFKVLNLIKNKYHQYLMILLIVSFLIYFSWITSQRLFIFFVILFYIYFYKLLMYLISNLYFKNIYIYYPRFINYLSYMFILSNPILLVLVCLEHFSLFLLKDNNKFKQFIVYILFIFIITPIKYIFFKLYQLYFKWKYYSILNITILRFIGLIISILIVTQIIQILIYYLSVWIYLMGYFLIVILLLMNEKLKTPWYLKFLFIENVSLYSLIYRRIDISILGQFLEYSNIIIFNKYNKLCNLDAISFFTFFISLFVIENYSKLIGKPYYINLFRLNSWYRESLDDITIYIFFKLFKNDLYAKLIKLRDKKEILDILDNWNKINLIFEYRYLYHKFLLFMVWDIEQWLGYDLEDKIEEGICKNIRIEGTYNVIGFWHFLELEEDYQYYNKILDKSLLDISIFTKIKKYDIMQFEDFINILTINGEDITDLKFKQRCTNIYLLLGNFLQENWMIWGAGPEESYIEYINNWYKEWSTINDKEKYYIQLLEELDIAYKNLQIKI